MSHALRYLLVSVRALLVFTLLLGVAYPFAVWAVAQVGFNSNANGSLIVRDGQSVGSSLIGQMFDGSEWFHPRPSAAGDGYDAMASSASNLAPTSPRLLRQVESRRAEAATSNGVAPAAIPPDAVTASGSGLDPHVSPTYALLQVERVADARGLTASEVRTLVEEHTIGRTLGFLGEPRVNILELNLALEELDG